MNPLLLTDGYKTGHHNQYPKNTRLIYSNFTPRSNKYAPPGCDKVVSFGQQMIMKQIHESFENEFFSKPKEVVCGEMKHELSLYLGTDYDVSHFESLHDLGYLPIIVKGIKEGSLVPIKIPVLTIVNTNPNFYWLTNYLETIISNLLWKPITSATIAHSYRKVLTKWQEKTDKERSWFVDWQGHDFSMRGMCSVETVISSGLGHSLSFLGSDSLPVIFGGRKYYNETGLVVGSVNATEHSVMSAGIGEINARLKNGDDHDLIRKYYSNEIPKTIDYMGVSEFSVFLRLLNDHPIGILSVVSDTFNLWKVLTEYLPRLKNEIIKQDGRKLVIRPDSGDPVDIICGYNSVESYELEQKKVNVIVDHPSYKGVIELLWDVFGGTINEQGYKVLDEHIGAIYGDSITIERAEEICKRLEHKGFTSTNIVLGIGSFTYQYNTRDTFGFAMKATYVEFIDSDKPLHDCVKGVEIFKDPITDDGTKKSATGLLNVSKDINGEYILNDRVDWSTESEGFLIPIYGDGEFYNESTLTEIRETLKKSK